MELDVTEKRFKKNLSRLWETGSFKTKLPKKTIKVSEMWIEMIEEPETATRINHENLSWTTCSDDQCGIQRSFKKNVRWYPKKLKKLGGSQVCQADLTRQKHQSRR